MTIPFVPRAQQLLVNGADVATYGAAFVAVEGWDDGPSWTDPTEPAPGPLWRAERTAFAPTPEPRTVTLTFAVCAATPAALRGRVATFRAAWQKASGATTGVLLEIPAFADDSGLTWRLAGGVVTATRVRTEGVPARAVVAQVAVTVQFADPVFETTSTDAVFFSTSFTVLPRTDAPTPTRLKVIGPCVGPWVEVRDGPTHNLTLAKIRFAGLTLASTSEFVEVDASTGAMTKRIAGVDSSALDDRTEGRPIMLDSRWWDEGHAPEIFSIPAASAFSFVEYRRRRP